MTLVTTLAAPPVLTVALKGGRGTKKESDSDDSQTFEWDFDSADIAQMVLDFIVRDLRSEGFYVQTMNLNDGIVQARKEKIALSIRTDESKLIAETSISDMGFVKSELYEVILRFSKSLKSVEALKNDFIRQSGIIGTQNRIEKKMVKYLSPALISCNLESTDKIGVIRELCALLAKSGAVKNEESVFSAVMEREKQMSTGLGNGIAFPHAHTDGVSELCVAIGIKKDGIDYESLDGQKAQIFTLIASPAEGNAPHMMVLSEMTGALSKTDVREKILDAKDGEEVISIIKACTKS